MMPSANRARLLSNSEIRTYLLPSGCLETLTSSADVIAVGCCCRVRKCGKCAGTPQSAAGSRRSTGKIFIFSLPDVLCRGGDEISKNVPSPARGCAFLFDCMEVTT